jgi:hypothetical protein
MPAKKKQLKKGKKLSKTKALKLPDSYVFHNPR